MKLGIFRLGIAVACFSFVSSASAWAQTAVAPIVDAPVAAAAPIAVAAPNPARAGANRFLAQSTFGARPADVDHLLQVGYAGWIDEQIASPLTFSYPQLALKKRCGMQRACIDSIQDIFWVGAVEDSNQLRQRMTFALSQIFVISVRDANSPDWGNAAAGFANVLYHYAFSNFRTLLNGVAHNSEMAVFLSFIYNDKENSVTGSIPDQNFARESMQLFTIGLVQLNIDGTPKLDVNGNTIPTYTQDDVVGASRVMTGFAPGGATEGDFTSAYCFCYDRAANQFTRMVALPAHHSVLEKKFLGVTIPATANPDPEADLRILINTLFLHPNVGPFIGKQLIKRLVTSNPTPGYVARVATVFNNNGSGVRGDMGAVIKAILLDPEARLDSSYATVPTFGKIREPVLRMAHIMRAFNATHDQDYYYHIPLFTDDSNKGLWQNPFAAPSVFNFYYPNYTPPLSTLAAQHLVAPEMQITTTTSISDQNDFFSRLFYDGGITDCCSPAQYNTFYLKLHYEPWLALTSIPAVLADRLNQALMAGQMSFGLDNDIRLAVAAVTDGHSPYTGELRGIPQIKLAEALRVFLQSPEYVVQK